MKKKSELLPPVRVTHDQSEKLQGILKRMELTYSEWVRDRIKRARK